MKLVKIFSVSLLVLAFSSLKSFAAEQKEEAAKDEVSAETIALYESLDENYKYPDAWAQGRFEKLKSLIIKGANVNNRATLLISRADDYGMTYTYGSPPIVLAANSGDIQKVIFLLENGASVNLADNFGNTALSTATVQDKPNIVKYLVEQGADPSLTFKDSFSKVWTPLMFSARNSSLEVVKALLESKNVNLDHYLDEGHGYSNALVDEGYGYLNALGYAHRTPYYKNIEDKPKVIALLEKAYEEHYRGVRNCVGEVMPIRVQVDIVLDYLRAP
jgi:hypothetical protein